KGVLSDLERKSGLPYSLRSGFIDIEGVSLSMQFATVRIHPKINYDFDDIASITRSDNKYTVIPRDKERYLSHEFIIGETSLPIRFSTSWTAFVVDREREGDDDEEEE
ncbi:hypothetical protein PENTCL1PPCAC_26133, partial [Pristionchus entomophagus]